MPSCRRCARPFPNWLSIDGARHNLSNRKYCLDCSPWRRHNVRQLERLPRQLPERKTCTRCGVDKPIDALYLRADGTRSHSWCKLCNTSHRKARFRADRYAALVRYSNGQLCCSCCGERHIEFLALDHVNDDGNVHRRAIGVIGGRSFYTWLRLTGYTYGALAVTCHNCNMARAMYGRCPHQQMPP